MCEIYYKITKVTVMALIVGSLIEAKLHNQPPYGDIGQVEDENTFELRNGANRYEYKNSQRLGNNNYQQLKAGQGGNYRNEYASSSQIRRSGERENSHYKNIDSNYYNRHNPDSERNYPKSWMVSSSIVEQHDNMSEQSRSDATDKKCSIWVPTDALDKYPEAEEKQLNSGAGLTLIEVCCSGYAPIRWRRKTLCRKVCDNCRNGRCTPQGVCECYDGYVKNDNGNCIFTCPMGCLNGRCYLDGSCQCEPGFKLDKSRKFCKPICSKGCGSSLLHNCTEPEICGCIKGYVLTDDDCKPVCQHDCGSNGSCEAPDKCVCNTGFELIDGFCQEKCYQKCDNGICFRRNRCICNPGFTYHERSTLCIPK